MKPSASTPSQAPPFRLLPLVLGWSSALLTAALALVSKWLNFPLSRQLRGIDFSLGLYTPAPQHPHLLSFGCIAAGLILLGAISFTLQWWRSLSWVGALLLWLTLLAPLKATMLDAGLLQILAVEATQQQLAAAFTQQALPVNFGSEPTQLSRLDLNTIEDRIVAAWDFVHAGWWFVLCGGLLAIGYGYSRSRANTVLYVTAAGLVGISVICCARPALAELALMRAHSAEARADLDSAEKAYRQAMRLDGWQALNIANYSSLGCLDEARGLRNTPEYRVYHAQLPSTQVDITTAIGELELVRAADPTFSNVVRRREAELYTQYARQLHALAAYGAAAAASQNALQRDPGSLLAAYYLSRDLYLIGRYADAVALSMKLATDVDDPTFRANLFSNAGDAYTMLRAYQDAKVAYRKSYLYDYVLNLRGLSALNGPGEDLQ